MSRRIEAPSDGLFSQVRGILSALINTRCNQACQVDRELMAMRTDLIRQSGWGAAGIH
jgi:hypothetical protein